MKKTGIYFIYGAGVYNILLGVFHVLFWKIPLFNWAEELNKLSPVNKGVMEVLNLCLIVVFIIMAFISFAHAKELLSSRLGRTILTGFSIFWLLRFIEQFIFWERAGIVLPVILIIGFILYFVPAMLSFRKDNS